MVSPTDSVVELGKIVGVFGVRGWVKVFSYTAEQDSIFDFDCWYIYQQKSWRKIKLLNGQRQGKKLVAALEGIEDRDAALALGGALIGVPRHDLPTLEKDEFYWSDLTGLNVITTSGIALGRIDYLFETGANDVMVVKGERERLLPWVLDNVVKSVDLEAGSVVVDWDPDF